MTNNTQSWDAIVIGGGIVGCSIAVALAERERKVALLEADTIGCGTSGNSFAWINGTAKTKTEQYHRLNALGLQQYLELARRWGEKRIGLNRVGTLQWASPAHGAILEALRATTDKLRAWGYPVVWVTSTELEAIEPHVRFPDGAEGLYALADAWLDVPVYLNFLVERLKRAGATILEHTPAESLIVNDDGKVLGVVTAERSLISEQVVLACGPATPEVLTQLTGYEGYAARFPMARAPGLLVTTPPDEHRHLVRHILYAGELDVHIRKGTSGGLLLGSDETDGLIEHDSAPGTVRQAARRLLEKTQAVLPDFAGSALLDQCRFRIGIRAVPADGDSIAGALPSAQGLFVVCTHSGVTMAPAIGKWSAEAVMSGKVPAQLEPFGLERFQM